MTHRDARRRAAAAFALLVGLSLTGAAPRMQRAASTSPIADEEYAACAAAMLKVVGGGSSFLVLDTTSMHDKAADLDRALSFPLEDAPRLTEDLVADFKAKNAAPHVFAPNFPTAVTVTLISEKDRQAMFAGCAGEPGCGWRAFYAGYPGAPGLTTLSRVGFNRAGDFALLYLGNVRDYEVGMGMYLLLNKRDGKWQVISRTRGWFS